VDELIERALRDLQGDDPIDLRVRLKGDRLVVQEFDRTEIWLPDDEDPESLVWRIADQLQEQVFPETRAAWGQARPPCPGHPHPASAELVGGRAMWVCPSSGQPLARIGDYAARRDA
jgi:hypothetical protein